MDEENVNQSETDETSATEENSSPETTPARRGIFTRRNFFASFAILVVLIGLLGLAGYLVVRFGYLDNYIKTQFISSMDEIGITFTADTFQTTLSPLTLELGNATFNDKLTGDKLLFIKSAKIGITITDLYKWQLSRDFRVDSTDIDGLEAWVKFDENGKSNFSNLNFAQEENGYVNLNYTAMKFSLQNAIVHFGDVQHKIQADAKNIRLNIETVDATVPDEQKRYNFNLASTDSNFVYDEKPVDPIDIDAQGVVYREGAEITQLKLNSPVASSVLSGNIEGWDNLRYNLKVDSTVDLMQAATIVPNDAALQGVGKFSGTVSGEGSKYNINGEISSDALSAAGVRLKGVQVNAQVSGEDAIYNANGKAIAEMLTFEDFKIDYPQLVGNVRGNGTNFKWVGELQAAAARTPAGTLAGLFVSDAVAELQDKKLEATFGNIRARNFNSPDAAVSDLQVRNVKLSNFNNRTDVSLPNVRAGLVKGKGFEVRGANVNNIRVRNENSQTSATADNLRADSLRTKDAQLKNISANDITANNRGNSTGIRVKNVIAGEVDASGALVSGVNANNVNVAINGDETTILSDNLRVAKVATDAASLGSINVAGVRLTIKNGRIEGSSGDINAGDVALTEKAIPGGGKIQDVKLARPVFVLEPSGRYRASLDLSLGGGVLGSVTLGAAKAAVVATNDQVALNNLTADVMNGNVNGNAVIALNNRNQSKVDADFSNLDLAKLLALQGGQIIPIAGQTTGKANLTFTGTNFRTASGTLVADFNASAGTDDRGFVPINGKLGLSATNGLFNIDYANLNTEKSAVTANGRFDLDGNNSNLQFALNSTDASEIERIIKVLNLSPALEEQLNSTQATFAGNLAVNGNLTGNLLAPTVDARASLDSIILRGRNLGSLATNIAVSPDTIELRDGKLAQPDGGNIAFNVNVPLAGENNIGVQATLTKVNTGNLLAALPIELPDTLKDFSGETSGTVQLSGLPKNISGSADLTSTNATVAGQAFDTLTAKATFQNSVVNIDNFEARSSDGFLRATGNFDVNNSIFDLNLEGKNLQIAKLKSLATKSDIPVDGTINLTAHAKGNINDPKSFDVNFNGAATNVLVNDNSLGTVTFVGTTANQQFNANITANIGNQPQVIAATVNFADPDLPFRAETNFNQTLLEPFIALASPPDNVLLTGKATGRVFLAGNLSKIDQTGKRVFSADDLKGEARFTEFSLMVNETPFVATNPLAVRFDMNAVTIDNAQFSGGGSNLSISGTKALSASAVNNLTAEGKLNLRILDVLSKNTFFTGISDVSVHLNGTNAEARLMGSASLANASFSTFVGSESISVNRINGRILFTSNQAQIDQLTGYLGGGKIDVSGGALLDGVQLQKFQLRVNARNASAPIIDGLVATGDATLDISGERSGEQYVSTISGNIDARRAIYTKDVDFADLISSRRTGGISEGTSSSSTFLAPRLNLTLEGRNALIVRNNLANLTASASLAVTGDTDDPVISGRITANEGGIIFFRNDRYEVQRGVLEFPPSTGEPFINLQAETEIQGYQIFVNLLGDLSDTNNLSATLRSNPALPQPDVVSLITTGSLANTGTGIPTLAQSGINTAAEIITDSLINNPARKATDKLFGLNKFELDPIISGTRVNPGARLTVGRQINRNLAVTYSTNLSEDQSQVLALEYRVSNRLSFVAQYQQRSLSNVTRNNDIFSVEIRLRKRF